MSRRKNLMNQRNEFVIITNGKETERNYFTALKSKKSPYDVTVLFENADPLGLVEYAKNYLDNSNQIWLVFDVDCTHQDGRLVPALSQADKIGVKCAFSNLAFEVWLISHFKLCEQELNIDGHKRILDKYLSEKKKGLVYEKNDIEILKKYFIPYYKTAINNSKIVYQRRTIAHEEKYGQNSKPKIWEWNSCTTVYKLVEALKLSE